MSQRQSSSSVINFEALAIGLQRLSALLSKTLENDGRQNNSLNIGTYPPYRVDSETCKVFVVCCRHLLIEEMRKNIPLKAVERSTYLNNSGLFLGFYT